MRNHREAPPSYIPDGDPGRHGGGTYTSHSVEPTLEAYENIFGPSARDIKQDLQRFKRHGRWHLPDILKGPNQYLTDRVDGLITDATNSPFTSRILPYKYIENVDGKIKWNVWSFDEGLASRVPYESAARTLQQSKRSFAGYFIRQGMAIVLEHNFMMSEAGRQNFKRQLNQLVGSIQLTNDLDVHVALVLAPSYQKTMNEKYMTQDKSSEQICREFVEMFGFVQKNQNALDILIEEAKGQLRTWGSPMPNFMLCNSKLTFQLTMTPDATNYVTKGYEGVKRLRTGPDLPSYRGIDIVHTRAFSMETGTPPRDILRRRVRVAEYHRILPHKDNHKRLFQIYNEGRDTWSTFTFQDLLQKAHCDPLNGTKLIAGEPGSDNNRAIQGATQAMNLGDKDEPRGAAPRLGAPLPASDSTNSITSYLSTLYDQLFTGKSALEFSWEPRPLSSNLVFVPGALDAVSVDTRVATIDPANFANFIQVPLTKQPLTGGPRAFDIRIYLNSVAAYPREVQSFARTLDTGNFYLTGVTGPTSWEAALNTCNELLTNTLTGAGGGAPANRQEKMDVYLKAHIRNYNRYGIPEALINPHANYGDANTTLRSALNPAYGGLGTNATILNQRLRSLGAWNCPNHFKSPNYSFSRVGDFLGYHCLITHEFVEKMIYSSTNQAQPNLFSGTLLHQLVTNKTRGDFGTLRRNLQTKMSQIYAAVKGMAAPQAIKRSHITKELLQDVNVDGQLVALRALFTRSKNTNFWWLWPRTESCDQDIYSNQVTEQWMGEVKNLGNWTDLDLTDNLLGDIDTAAMDTSAHSINFNVPMPTTLPDVTEQDVDCFLNMLAWRFFADQEIPLPQVYNMATGNWRPFDQYVFPGLTGVPPHFGQGIMLYGDPSSAPQLTASTKEVVQSNATQDIEIVIVRPNIEHYMMGIILGQGGEGLGSTFWGQTELSCYDDSMHGIWGMSYKYHERAIVINERNLIRLWDIAYDGYVGGKDDVAVDWNDDSDDPRLHPNSWKCFMQATTDVTRPYRGPSMLVMAFHHGTGKSQTTEDSMDTYHRRHFQTNWPSPIVFYDRGHEQAHNARADFDNLHVVESEQFRVFNNPLYHNAYQPYRMKMPDFWELHTIRKNAGLAAVENEVSSEALAFQGTMRILSSDSGAVIQETLGSGHHGPDFIGVASLRAGKGYKINSQPTIQRLV